MGRMRSAALHGVVLTALLPLAANAEEPPPFDGSRAALEFPDHVWAQVLADAGRPQGRIGYGADEMRAFGKDTHLLRTVQAGFADVRKLPRESGRITEGLLENATRPSEVLARAYALTDVSAGRMYVPPTNLRWGLEDPDSRYAHLKLELAETPELALRRLAEGEVEGDLAAVPVAAQRLLVRVWVGVLFARMWQARAHPPGSLFESGPETLSEAAADGEPESLSRAQHDWARKVWSEEWHGQAAVSDAAPIELLSRWRRGQAAYAAAVLAVHLERALEEYRAAPEAEREPKALTAPVRLGGTLPEATIYGPGADTVQVPPGTALTLDLGGDDHWSGYVGASMCGDRSPDSDVSVHLDLGGNDAYAADGPAALAVGLFGIGVLLDLKGDDVYEAQASGLGCGLFGTGLLYDLAGNDVYRSKGPFGQGSGHVGVGVLLDLEGDDDYECVEQAQGLGGTLGAGLLVDVKGNDSYVARDDGNVSALYKNQSVAMAQGCGYGRRADLGDGMSLAGGVGILVDGAGDDRYHAQVWAQGCGYWWALGILEDRGGDDQWQNGKYSAGAAAHFAIGVCIDLAGDDVHNGTNTTAVNQWQGHARDGSIGLFIDGDGDDGYDVNNHCAGAADLNSIGVFWDRRGADRYTFHDKALGPANGWNDTGAFGTATRYPPFRSFRDDLPSWGIFLDTGGTDSYGVETAPTTFQATPARDGTIWKTVAGPLVYGLGYDLNADQPDGVRPR